MYGVVLPLLINSITTEKLSPCATLTGVSKSIVYAPSYEITPDFCADSLPLSGFD